MDYAEKAHLVAQRARRDARSRVFAPPEGGMDAATFVLGCLTGGLGWLFYDREAARLRTVYLDAHRRESERLRYAGHGGSSGRTRPRYR